MRLCPLVESQQQAEIAAPARGLAGHSKTMAVTTTSQGGKAWYSGNSKKQCVGLNHESAWEARPSVELESEKSSVYAYPIQSQQ